MYSEFSIIRRLRLSYNVFVFKICSVRIMENFEEKKLSVRLIETVRLTETALFFEIVLYNIQTKNRFAPTK